MSTLCVCDSQTLHTLIHFHYKLSIWSRTRTTMSTHLTMTQCRPQHLTLQLLLLSLQSPARIGHQEKYHSWGYWDSFRGYFVLGYGESVLVGLLTKVVDVIFLQPLLNGPRRRCQKSRASRNFLTWTSVLNSI